MGKNHVLLREPGLQVGPFRLSPGVITDAGEGARGGGPALASTLITSPPRVSLPPAHRTPAPNLQLLIIPTPRPKPSKGILSRERYPAKSSPNTTRT